MKIHNLRQSQTPKARMPEAGFTIIELIIATLVFSVILLLLTSGIIQITRSYYKGVIETNTQNAARNVVESIGQAIQFSKGTIAVCSVGSCTPTQRVVCIGNLGFSFVLGKQLVDTTPTGTGNESMNVLRENPITDTGSCPPALFATTGTELLGPHMRLANLDVHCVNLDASGNCIDGLWSVNVRVVYGDDDLLFSPKGLVPEATAPDATCKSQTGSQFCAVSEITSTVQRRLTKTTED